MRRLALVSVLTLLVLAPSAGATPTVAFTGHGWGHGVGMSQWGADGLARHGRSHEQILQYYYPGTRLDRRPEPTIRVLLGAGETKIRVGSRRAFVVVDDAGTRIVVKRRVLGLGPRLRVRGRFLRSPLRILPGAMPLRLNGRPYRGRLVVRSRGGRMSVVNELGAELYLRGVVPLEMPDEFHLEALAAQAVAARSYAYTGLRPDRIFDVVDTAADQVYGGLLDEKDRTDAAVVATSGQVLTWGGSVARAYYHSTSGGRTAAAEDVFGFPVPYLRSRDDPFDVGSPHHVRNRVVLTPRLLAARLKQPALRTATDVTCELNGSGRPVTVVVETKAGTRRFAAERVQKALGVQGEWFDVGVLSLDRPARVVAGRAVTLVGVARDVGEVTLERLHGSAWLRVGDVRVRGDGGFARRVRALRNTTYRLRAGTLTSSSVFVPGSPRARR